MKPCKKVLIIDDELAMPGAAAEFSKSYGIESVEYQYAGSYNAVKDTLLSRASIVSLVLLDMRFEGIGDAHGLEILREITKDIPRLPVVIMSTSRDPEILISSWDMGAKSYIIKWGDNTNFFSELKEKIEKFAIYEQEELILGASPKIEHLLQMIKSVAPYDATILIQGETGTGKELVAETLHAKSSRSNGPLVKVNCGAIPDNLMASELFGYKKGTFTGADRDRKGKVEEAEGGILFLDEIGEMKLELQTTLLRFLDKREFSRIGESLERKADVQVIAATNRDIQSAVREGVFREDLYHRLNEFKIETPPLRECRSDIPMLAEHFLELQKNRRYKPVSGFTTEIMDFFCSYDWPGNVRELEKTISRCYILTESGDIKIDVLPGDIKESGLSSRVSGNDGVSGTIDLKRYQCKQAWNIIRNVATQELSEGRFGLKKRVALRIDVNPNNGLSREIDKIIRYCPDLESEIVELFGSLKHDQSASIGH